MSNLRQNRNGFSAGVNTSVEELIATRPDLSTSGFAPGGKVSTHQFGVNHSVFSGRGMEFDESRVYQPGDDVKTIDWRVTARTGEVHTKLFREERERPVFILLDCRRAMHFGTRVRFKSVLAAQTAAMLCWVGIDGGDRVGGFVLDQCGLRDFPATRSRTNMLGFMRAMSDATRSQESVAEELSLSQALRRLRLVCRTGTLVFIISDFDDLDEIALAEIKRLSLHAHVTNVLVYDPLDLELPARGDLKVSDGDRVLSLQQLGAQQRDSHTRDFAERRELLKNVSRKRAMAFHALPVSAEPKSILHPHRRFGPRYLSRRLTA
ncbi:MAG: DUF58 domain-containing protein [Lysobacterales bacterium]